VFLEPAVESHPCVLALLSSHSHVRPYSCSS